VIAIVPIVAEIKKIINASNFWYEILLSLLFYLILTFSSISFLLSPFGPEMKEEKKREGFIPEHGGYKNLLTYQKAEIIYDGTIYFTRRFFKNNDRTVDQMVQAARSGKQNIAEASMASATSKETEIKLTNVARASLEELLIDFDDFLRTNKLNKMGSES
jgi:four helix bundle protein